MSAFVLAVLLAAEAAAAPLPEGLTEPAPEHMTSQQIHDFNAMVPREHKWHIRCISETPTGSLAGAIRTCHTNAQWTEIYHSGNNGARDMLERMRPSQGWDPNSPGGGG